MSCNITAASAKQEKVRLSADETLHDVPCANLPRRCNLSDRLGPFGSSNRPTNIATGPTATGGRQLAGPDISTLRAVFGSGTGSDSGRCGARMERAIGRLAPSADDG